MSFWRDLQRKRTHVPIRFGRSLLTVRPLRAGTSSASPQGVERPVNRCAQVLHRNAWTPLHNRGKIVDMIAPVGVLISAAAPPRGAVALLAQVARWQAAAGVSPPPGWPSPRCGAASSALR